MRVSSIRRLMQARLNSQFGRFNCSKMSKNKSRMVKTFKKTDFDYLGVKLGVAIVLS